MKETLEQFLARGGKIEKDEPKKYVEVPIRADFSNHHGTPYKITGRPKALDWNDLAPNRM